MRFCFMFVFMPIHCFCLWPSIRVRAVCVQFPSACVLFVYSSSCRITETTFGAFVTGLFRALSLRVRTVCVQFELPLDLGLARVFSSAFGRGMRPGIRFHRSGQLTWRFCV